VRDKVFGASTDGKINGLEEQKKDGWDQAVSYGVVGEYSKGIFCTTPPEISPPLHDRGVGFNKSTQTATEIVNM
jgi:hypothetical protein